MQAPEISEVSKSIAQRFCDALTAALKGASSSSWQVTSADQPSGTKPEAPTSASFRCGFEGTYAGDAIVVFALSALSKLSLRDLPADAAGDTPAAQKAQAAKLLTVLQEGLAGVATSLDETGATSLRVESLDPLVLADEQVLELWMQSDPKDPATRIVLHLCVSQKLLTALQTSSAKPFVFPDAAASTAANLDLVMDVELNVTLRFGQRQLALREVLELTSGSVVELDRQVDEPVELILDGRVVARGEAVIIDGNYGMRITQLLQPMIP